MAAKTFFKKDQRVIYKNLKKGRKQQTNLSSSTGNTETLTEVKQNWCLEINLSKNDQNIEIGLTSLVTRDCVEFRE